MFKTRPLILLVFCFCSCLGYSQELDSVFDVQNFEFKKYRSGKVKNIATGTHINVYFHSQDPNRALSGFLLNVNDSTVIVNMDYEQFWRNSEDNFYEESFTYDTLKRTSIPISSIDYIQLDNGFLPGFLSDGFAVTGVVSVLTTLFVAPLVSIDKDSPYRFNSKRYTRIVIPALIGSVVGWTAYGLLGKHNGKKLKL